MSALTENLTIDQEIEGVDTFDDYAQLAQRTAIFPERQALGYLGLGLVDETQEFVEKIDSLKRLSVIPEDSSDLVGEAGDVYWYMANLANQLGITKRLNLTGGNPDFYNDRPVFEDVLDAERRARTHLLPNAAEIAGHLKKIIRGDEADKRLEVENRLRKMLSMLDMIIAYLQMPAPRDVAKANLRKLFDRQERGKLKGDGDNR